MVKPANNHGGSMDSDDENEGSMSAESKFNAMLASWNLNGTRYLHSSYPIWFRIIWFILLMAMVLAMILQILDLTKQYRQNPILHETNYTKAKSLAFPNIMICFPKAIDASEIERHFGRGLADALRNARQPIDNTALEEIFRKYDTNKSQSSWKDPNVYRNFYQAIQPIDFHISACFYDGVGEMNEGRCMTDAFHIGPPKDTCYAISMNESQTTQTSSDNSIARALHIQLQTDRRNKIFTTGIQREGEIAQVFFYDDFSPNFDGIFIFNRSHVEIPLRIEKAVNLVDFDHCSESINIEMSLKEGQCFQEESLKGITNQCGCTILWGETDNNTCTTLQELFCIDPTIDALTEAAGLKCFLQCLRKEFVSGPRYVWNAQAYPRQKFEAIEKYASFGSQLFFKKPSQEFLRRCMDAEHDLFYGFKTHRNGSKVFGYTHARGEESDNQFDWAKITIYFSDLHSKTTTKRISYNFWRLASDIGGTIALYMGCCIAALIELLFSCTRIEDRIKAIRKPDQTVGALANLVALRLAAPNGAVPQMDLPPSSSTGGVNSPSKKEVGAASSNHSISSNGPSPRRTGSSRRTPGTSETIGLTDLLGSPNSRTSIPLNDGEDNIRRPSTPLIFNPISRSRSTNDNTNLNGDNHNPASDPAAPHANMSQQQQESSNNKQLVSNNGHENQVSPAAKGGINNPDTNHQNDFSPLKSVYFIDGDDDEEDGDDEADDLSGADEGVVSGGPGDDGGFGHEDEEEDRQKLIHSFGNNRKQSTNNHRKSSNNSMSITETDGKRSHLNPVMMDNNHHHLPPAHQQQQLKQWV